MTPSRGISMLRQVMSKATLLFPGGVFWDAAVQAMGDGIVFWRRRLTYSGPEVALTA